MLLTEAPKNFNSRLHRSRAYAIITSRRHRHEIPSGVIGINGTFMTNEELTRVYTLYRDMVYRLALTKTRSRAQAEDIQQDVFMALVKYSDRIRDDEHLKAWLIRVTQNACRKHFRSMWIKLTVMYDDALGKGDSQGDGSGEPVAEDELEKREEAEFVRESVEKLNQNDRELIYLFYYEEMSLKQIAAALSTSEGSIKTRLSRARERLRSMAAV